MKFPLFAAIVIALAGVLLLGESCGDQEPSVVSGSPDGVQVPTSTEAAIIASLTDPAKLDMLTGERAATPRLRKACYWIETARREGEEPAAVIESAQRLNGSHTTPRGEEVARGLLRNRLILERLGCLDETGMEKLRRGKAPTITKGPYVGEGSHQLGKQHYLLTGGGAGHHAAWESDAQSR